MNAAWRHRIRTLEARAIDAAILHGMGIGSWAAFELMRRRCDRFRRALDSFEATYQFRTGSTGRLLRFSAGRVRTRAGTVESPDYELVLLDAPAVVRQMRKDPNDMLRLLLENRIDQRGNNYYLFKYGYLWGLCRRHALDIAQRWSPRRVGSGSRHAA